MATAATTAAAQQELMGARFVDVRGAQDEPVVLQPPDPVLRLAQRATASVSPRALLEIQTAGPLPWIDQQLRSEQLADDEMDALLHRFPTLTMAPAELDAALQTGDVSADSVASEQRAAAVLRAALSRRQLLEVVVGFWRHRFGLDEIPLPMAVVPALGAAVRAHALATFDGLTDSVGELLRWSGARTTVPLDAGGATAPAVAHAVAASMARWFVGEDPDPATIDRAERAFRLTDGRIVPTLRVILLSDDFWYARGRPDRGLQMQVDLAAVVAC